MISIAALAEKSGIIGNALREWANDRIHEYFAAAFAAEDATREKADNGQFGVGA